MWPHKYIITFFWENFNSVILPAMFPNKLPVKQLETIKVHAMSPPIPKFCMSIT